MGKRNFNGTVSVHHQELNERIALSFTKHQDLERCHKDMKMMFDELVRREYKEDQLREKIARLEKQLAQAKTQENQPTFREPKLEAKKKKAGGKKNKKSKNNKGKRAKPKKPKSVESKQVLVECEPEHLPADAKFHDHYDYTVQDLEISLLETRYRIKRYVCNGEIISGSVPEGVRGKFGAHLKSFILTLNHALHGTEPRIHEFLSSLGVSISEGSISNILMGESEEFQREMAQVLSVGIEKSEYIQTDDTGAFHNGENYICTAVGNEFFSAFKTTKRKNRIEFLSTLQGEEKEFLIDADALAYAVAQGMNEEKLTVLGERERHFRRLEDLERCLYNRLIESAHDRRVLTEGALISALKKRYAKELLIVSDEAGQFNVFHRGLCWIHAERHFRKLVAVDERMESEIEAYREKIWRYYKLLKKYKKRPSPLKKRMLWELFDSLFKFETEYKELAEAVFRFIKKKAGLLLVLEHACLPLHNNLSENHIRDFVMRRKVSPTTRSEQGRQARDALLGVKKTCKKLGLNFFEFVHDRISGHNIIQPLHLLVAQKIAASQ